MIGIRRSHERGYFDHGWLKTHHTFSFGEYVSPEFHDFRTLRVLNEDRVAPGAEFGRHGHRDMEIVTCVLAGELQHHDSLGNGSIIRPGEFQRMTAGSGVQHSEGNPSPNLPAHFYQIWLFPDQRGLTPEYEQRAFDRTETSDRWRTVASPDGRDQSLRIHQNAVLLRSHLSVGRQLALPLQPDRAGWLQVMQGTATLRDSSDQVIAELQTGDGVLMTDERAISVTATTDADLLFFDLP